MIKVHIKDNTIEMSGHAEYEEYGKDIVCASCSSIVITSINACLKLDSKSLSYEETTDKLAIVVLSKKKSILVIIKNMVDMLQELADNYPKNIKVDEEEN